MSAAIPYDDSRAAGLSRSLRVLLALARRIALGELFLTVPDGRTFYFRGSQSGPSARIVIHRPRVARRVLLGGALGFAESYMDGDWDTPNLAALLEFFVVNEGALGPVSYGKRLLTSLRRMWHTRRRNTRPGSRRNIAYHYDLGNAFYAEWLDPTMTYSSAVFARADQELSAAQVNKYRHIADKLALSPDHHLLEIGCGWGGFARHVAREVGARVTAITVSREQCEFARRRTFEEGLSERVDVRFVDYRDVRGSFDRVASIEMFEAVGEKYWPVFFGKLRDNLAPGGRAALQVITIADQFFDAYRRGVDFIQRYIFPGGMLPSPSALRAAIEAAGLAFERQDFFGAHYARTLGAWQQRFQAAWPTLTAIGFDQRFKRMWEFYLAYCEAGFRARTIDVTQVALVRP